MYTRTHRLLLAALCLLATVAAAGAQQTTGTIAGRVLDEQKAAVPGATVTAKNDSTGFSRSEVSDAEGAAGDIQWNFEKFLIDPDGVVVGRFRPRTEPDAPEIRAAIEAVLPG